MQERLNKESFSTEKYLKGHFDLYYNTLLSTAHETSESEDPSYDKVDKVIFLEIEKLLLEEKYATYIHLGPVLNLIERLSASGSKAFKHNIDAKMEIELKKDQTLMGLAKKDEANKNFGDWYLSYSHQMLTDDGYAIDKETVLKVAELIAPLGKRTHDPVKISYEVWLATIYKTLTMVENKNKPTASLDKEALLKAEKLLLEKENLQNLDVSPAFNFLSESLSEGSKKYFKSSAKYTWRYQQPWDEERFGYRSQDDFSNVSKAKMKIYMAGEKKLVKETEHASVFSCQKRAFPDTTYLTEIKKKFSLLNLEGVKDKEITDNIKNMSADLPKQDKDISK